MGHDGYQQQLTYDANGMRLSKREAGNSNRSTLEELLRGDIPGLPEIVEPSKSQTNKKDDTVPEELEWATTEYLYDLTQEYYQVIQEKKTSKSDTSKTAYAYGLERIAGYSVEKTDITDKTSYVYDGRGSVVQAVVAPAAGQKTLSSLPNMQVKVQSFSYAAFGEQMGRKISGFGYNAEDFDAATGMINLRARLYEPTVNRFSQKDILYGFVTAAISLNRSLYCVNNPLNYYDANGLLMESIGKSLAGAWKAIKSTFAGAYNGLTRNAHTFLERPSWKTATNWLSMGGYNAFENQLRINAQNFQKATQNPTVGNWANYFLSGQLDNAKMHLHRALDPSNPEQQWKSSFWVCSVVFAGYSAAGGQSVITGSTFPSTQSVIQWGDRYGAASGVVPAGTFDEAFKFSTSNLDNIWDMAKGGRTINGRRYSQHALERMAPDTPQVRAELYTRATKLAQERGFLPGTTQYSKFVDKYVNPRGIPPSVVENAILHGTKSLGNTVNTYLYITDDVGVIVNSQGDVITVYPK